MFRLTLLCGLTLASSAVAIGGLLSYHYYPAIIAVAITGILIWAIVTMMVDESRHKKSAATERSQTLTRTKGSPMQR
jgi:hypothetical protein